MKQAGCSQAILAGFFRIPPGRLKKRTSLNISDFYQAANGKDLNDL
ncbi:MAG: hypothetical protein R6W81_07625 [Bacteroidales bacterium]